MNVPRLYPRSQLWLLRLAILFAGLAFSANALSTRELRIENFHSDVTVLKDGTIDVTERISVNFLGGPWHGVYRSIPIQYVTPQGLTYKLFLDVKSVTDGNGDRLKFEKSRERHYLQLKIYVPNADNSRQTINIEYSVSDALRFFEDHDEFYWNVTGDEWNVPIHAASSTITLPRGTTNVRANAFTGAYGSTGRDAEAAVTGDSVEVHTTSPLGLHEGLTVAVAFDKGIVHEPTPAELAWRFLRSNWIFVLPIGVFAGMFWLWWTRGRDPRLRSISAQYEPPDQLTPGEVGTLVDNSVDMRDITATIVDLAVRGYVVIEERTKERMMGLMHDKDYVFHLKKPREYWGTLKDHEQEVLDAIFTGGTTPDVSLSDLHNKFYQYIPGIRSEVFSSLITKGYYKRRPDSVRSSYLGAAAFLAFLGVAASSQIGAFLALSTLTVAVAVILSAIAVAAFGWFMPARTVAGARALEGVLGFEDFLSHVESDRLNRMIKTPEMFEKFLPFAMALGVEKNWSKAFEGIYTQPPSWYQGGYGTNFVPYMFVNNLSSMSSQAASVMASAPRSSGGSGFGGGGGGFSGGGFGGGGGGGF